MKIISPSKTINCRDPGGAASNMFSKIPPLFPKRTDVQIISKNLSFPPFIYLKPGLYPDFLY